MGLVVLPILLRNKNCHSHKKRKDSLKGSLNRELFADELEFWKMLVRRLPQHTSNVNIKCAGKSKTFVFFI